MHSDTSLAFDDLALSLDPVLRWGRRRLEVGNGARLVSFETLVSDGACRE